MAIQSRRNADFPTFPTGPSRSPISPCESAALVGRDEIQLSSRCPIFFSRQGAPLQRRDANYDVLLTCKGIFSRRLRSHMTIMYHPYSQVFFKFSLLEGRILSHVVSRCLKNITPLENLCVASKGTTGHESGACRRRTTVSWHDHTYEDVCSIDLRTIASIKIGTICQESDSRGRFSARRCGVSELAHTEARNTSTFDQLKKLLSKVLSKVD